MIRRSEYVIYREKIVVGRHDAIFLSFVRFLQETTNSTSPPPSKSRKKMPKIVCHRIGLYLQCWDSYCGSADRQSQFRDDTLRLARIQNMQEEPGKVTEEPGISKYTIYKNTKIRRKTEKNFFIRPNKIFSFLKISLTHIVIYIYTELCILVLLLL